MSSLKSKILFITGDSRGTTGNSFLDEAALRKSGVADFSSCLVTPGMEPIIDLYVEP